jgi:catechol 2,3-dioxygenase-like lactoylglutathione lyase family enzyme
VARSSPLHHIELWVPDLARAERSWGWLLTRLGAELYRSWEHGRSWRFDAARGGVYVVVEQSPALTGDRHERRSPGLNHLAFWAGSPDELDGLVAEAADHGWRLMFTDRHPFAGGPEHRAAYLEDSDGYEVELVAGPVHRLAPS